MYNTGKGVPQDDGQAVRWYTKSAEAGNEFGQSTLGLMYESGLSVPQDYILAHMWFNLAAAQSNKQATDNRDRLVKQMTPAQIVEAQKLAREWQPTTETQKPAP